MFGLVILFSTQVTNELQKGTLINLLSKGLQRYQAIISKWFFDIIMWITSYSICFLIAFGYTKYYFGSTFHLGNILMAALLPFIFGVFLISLEILANFMMVTKASVSRWEPGKSYPDILLLLKIAAFFNITIDELIGYEPQVSTEQIRKIYGTFVNSIFKENIDDIIKNVKATINQYYSCFKLLYYMGMFIVNHCDLTDSIEKRKEYLEYANNIFKRICDSSEDSIKKTTH